MTQDSIWYILNDGYYHHYLRPSCPLAQWIPFLLIYSKNLFKNPPLSLASQTPPLLNGRFLLIFTCTIMSSILKIKRPRFHFFTELLGCFFVLFYSKLFERCACTPYFYFLAFAFFPSNFSISPLKLFSRSTVFLHLAKSNDQFCQFSSYSSSSQHLSIDNVFHLEACSIQSGDQNNPSFPSNSLATPWSSMQVHFC